MKYKYKLKDEYLKDGERTFPNHGITKQGIIETDTAIESPLLDIVEGPKTPEAPAAPETPGKPIASATSAPTNQEPKQ
jgi:hypothetical protein